MTTSTAESAITCPSWCLRHEDIKVPHRSDPERRATYMERTDGAFIHASAQAAVDGIDGGVSVTNYTDWNGRELAPPIIWVGDNSCSVEQAGDLIERVEAAIALLG